jgi:P27 family predicted phage terminase small subunit
MKPGTKPKPTELKRLAGNPGRRPLNDSEPKIAGGLPTCPAYLDKVARREFNRVLKAFGKTRLLTIADRGTLAMMCQMYSRWIAAERSIAEDGLVVKTSFGNLIQNPAIGIANRCCELYMRAAVEFGMTPSSRSRLSVPESKPAKSLSEQLDDAVKEGRLVA